MTTDEDRFRILIVDDEPSIRAGLGRALACRRLRRVATAADATEALDSVAPGRRT